MRSFFHTLHTDGKTSLWSRTEAAIRTTKINLAYVNDEEDFGELRVYFKTDDWNVNEEGLIYTDHTFIKELRYALFEEGIVGDIDYSEQGMQGDNYVSCDVDSKFIQSYMKDQQTWNEYCQKQSKMSGTQQWAETYLDNLGESED
jgi:hypothetical protein